MAVADVVDRATGRWKADARLGLGAGLTSRQPLLFTPGRLDAGPATARFEPWYAAHRSSPQRLLDAEHGGRPPRRPTGRGAPVAGGRRGDEQPGCAAAAHRPGPRLLPGRRHPAARRRAGDGHQGAPDRRGGRCAPGLLDPARRHGRGRPPAGSRRGLRGRPRHRRAPRQDEVGRPAEERRHRSARHQRLRDPVRRGCAAGSCSGDDVHRAGGRGRPRARDRRQRHLERAHPGDRVEAEGLGARLGGVERAEQHLRVGDGLRQQGAQALLPRRQGGGPDRARRRWLHPRGVPALLARAGRGRWPAVHGHRRRPPLHRAQPVVGGAGDRRAAPAAQGAPREGRHAGAALEHRARLLVGRRGQPARPGRHDVARAALEPRGGHRASGPTSSPRAPGATPTSATRRSRPAATSSPPRSRS